MSSSQPSSRILAEAFRLQTPTRKRIQSISSYKAAKNSISDTKDTTMQNSSSLLLVLAAAICYTEAWITAQQTVGRSLLKCQLSACSLDEERNLSRRFFLTGLGSISAFLLTASPAMADDSSSDPFAQMDAIAAEMGSSSSNDPNSASPLFTNQKSSSPQESTAEPLPKAPASAASSDMQKVLEEAKRRRKVAPLTHG